MPSVALVLGVTCTFRRLRRGCVLASLTSWTGCFDEGIFKGRRHSSRNQNLSRSRQLAEGMCTPGIRDVLGDLEMRVS